MRRSYRLSLIAASLLAGAAVAPSRDVFFAPAPLEQASRKAQPLEALEPAGVHHEFGWAGFRRLAESRVQQRDAVFRRGPERDRGLSRDAAAGVPGVEVETGLHWIGVFETPAQPLVAVGGLDLAAPRNLTLWKLDEFRRHATAVTHLQSEVGRPFLAEHLLLSARGARLVVAPHGAQPFGPWASTVLEVPARNVSRTESR